MKTINYNGRDLLIGSIAENDYLIEEHMVAHFNINETDESEWFLKFNSQVNEMKNFIELTNDKHVLLDIGSQFGSFSFPFIGNSTTKKVFAFDGGIAPFLVTSQMKVLNDLTNFNVFNFLIGNQDEIVQCFSENLQSLAIPGNDNRIMFKIDTVNHLYNINPDVIKIDIEGYEYQALLGAKNTILESKPIIFIEIHPKFLTHYGDNINNIVSFVNLINYDVFDLNGIKIDNYLQILENESSDSNRTVWIPKQ